ncbi:MAG: SDR family NAD(P)-dependent oxidoreductase, partial [Clostridium sp.]|nr:SDR family NAD(P)-dependent oxidoreductase [Clostridium sp.]
MNNREIVLITGASSGIGYEMAKIFAMHKYNLILVARSTDKLREIANKLTIKYKIKTYVIREDLSKIDSAKKVFEKVLDMGLKVDILINNAGVGKVGLFHDMK